MRLYVIKNNTLKPQYISEGQVQTKNMASATWIDMCDPSGTEKKSLQRLLLTQFPESTAIQEIEASARFFTDKSGIHIYSLFLEKKERCLQNVSVAFILQPSRLISIRHGKGIADFRLLRLRIRNKMVQSKTPHDLLVTIFDYKVENLADAIEDIYSELEKVSHQILSSKYHDHEQDLEQLASLEDENGKIRLCLMDTQRALTFLRRQLHDKPDLQGAINDIMHDIETLLPHTTFLFDKINFLMDASLGFINLEQNKIIKTFSIAAVVFMPPTVIASIYGMNFEHIPELKFIWGYPGALVLMILSGIAPYWIFKAKGWLK